MVIDQITGEVFEGDQGLTDAYTKLKYYERSVAAMKRSLQAALQERYNDSDVLKNQRMIKCVERVQWEYPYSGLQEIFDEDQIALVVKPSITKIKEIATKEQLDKIERIKEVGKVTKSFRIL